MTENALLGYASNQVWYNICRRTDFMNKYSKLFCLETQLGTGDKQHSKHIMNSLLFETVASQELNLTAKVND